MAWPPEPEVLENKSERQIWPTVLRVLMLTVLSGCVVYGLSQFFVTTKQSVGWGVLAALATISYQWLSYCTSNSSRDNDGGSSQNHDAFNGLD